MFKNIWNFLDGKKTTFSSAALIAMLLKENPEVIKKVFMQIEILIPAAVYLFGWGHKTVKNFKLK